MKRIILLTWILLSVSYLRAQLAFGIPVNFSSLNSEVYNPGVHNDLPSNMWVTDRTNEELSFSEKTYLYRGFGDIHPGHIILDEATVTYNCHGYTFGLVQGTDRYNISWSADLCNDAFDIVTVPQTGDIAVMRYNNGQVDSPHSAIVYNQDTLISKWGELPLTKHHKDSVIGIAAFEMGNAHYTYYRRIINTQLTGPDIIDGSGTYVFTPTPNISLASCIWSVEPADMFQTASGTGTTANLTYKTPFTYLAPKARITFTFSYSCDNHYSVSKEIDLLIPTTTISGTAVSDGFVLDTNAVVTVTGEIRSNHDAKIIVPKGTRFVIDGGSMTSNGDAMWPGIQVWGDSTLHQHTVHGNYLQGYLELKNGATIENAVCAVALWHPGDWNSTGGIVFADSAFFRNNAKSVRALYYVDHVSNGNQELAYNSSFRNRTFTVDNDYLGTETFERHVHLYKISSLEFIGCHFSVDPEATGVSPWRCAIQADDAGFTATARCKDPNSYMTPQSCPDEYLERCSFTGFYNALYANNSGGSARTFTVSDAVFTGNDCGVRAENTGLATVIRNSFALGCGEDCAFGVYAQNTANHCIEENDFAPATGFMGATYGVGLFDCGGANDVYRNDFEGLTCGNLAVGVNTAKTEGLHGIVAQGLTYTCNTNTSNTVDFCVLKDENGGGSIRAQQGSSTLPAGNTFDASGYHFYNDGNDTVDYYYNGSATGQTPSTSKIYRVNRISTNSTNPCLSHYGGGTVVKSPEEKAQLEDDFHSAQEDIDLLVSLYKRRLAAGGTADELADLRAQMAQRVHDRSMAAGDIVRSILNDTVTDHRELRTWLRNMGDLASDRLAIASYVQEGDFDGAFSLAQTLPSLYGLEGDELSDHANHLRLLGLHRALRQSGRTTTQLTDDERLMVEDIARAGYPYSGSLAAALLETGGLRGDDRSFCPELPRIADRGRGETGTEEREASDLKVTVTPNPASSQVNVEYILSEGSSRAMLSILNTLGEKMTELGLEGNRGSTVVDLRELPAGVYFFVVTDQSGRTSSSKIAKK